MKKITKTFYDCEHGGDVEEIEAIINKAGGNIISKNFNYDAEQLTLVIEVADINNFLNSVKDEYWFN